MFVKIPLLMQLHSFRIAFKPDEDDTNGLKFQEPVLKYGLTLW